MAIADASTSTLASIKEANWGVTPTSPTFRRIRQVSNTLDFNREYRQSQEIRPDRNVSANVLVGQSTGGDVNAEFSYGAFDDWLASALFTDWAADEIKNGVTPSSYTLETIYKHGGTDTYRRFTGQMVNTFNLQIPVQDLVTCSFGFMGKGGSVSGTAIAGSSYTDSVNNQPFNASTDVKNIAMSGITSPKLTQLNLTVDNSLRVQNVIGGIDAAGVGMGTCLVTGTGSLFFETREMLELFLSDAESDLSFDLENGGNKYAFSIPTLKFTQASSPTPGINQDIVQEFQITGQYDASSLATIGVTRVPISGS